jgi:glycosyltransferase involved in cell wall biosynthesis
MNIGLVIPTYNRPEYLKSTLDSIYASDLPKGMNLILIDDGSTQLLPDAQQKLWAMERKHNITTEYRRMNGNAGMFKRLHEGLSVLSGSDVYCTLDSDAIVKPHWFTTLLDLYQQFPDRIITGFNAPVRHPAHASHPTYHEKLHIGGINLLFGPENYELVKGCLTNIVWDWEMSRRYRQKGKSFICTNPSVIQHIGLISTVNQEGGPPDLAEDF